MNLYFRHGLVLVIQMVFGFYIYCLLFRLAMQKLRASVANPLSQFVIKITRYTVVPFQKILPGFRGYDFAIIILLFVFQFIEVIISYFILTFSFPVTASIIVVVLGKLIFRMVNAVFMLVLLSAISSWISSRQYNPLIDMVNFLSQPFMRLCRRFIPLVGGVDLSPMAILFFCQIIIIFIAKPLAQYGVGYIL